MSRVRYLAPPPAELDEDAVRLIAKNVIDEYEEKIALPRHREASDRQEKALDLMKEVRGGVKVIKWLFIVMGGSLSGLLTVLKILELAKGHL